MGRTCFPAIDDGARVPGVFPVMDIMLGLLLRAPMSQSHSRFANTHLAIKFGMKGIYSQRITALTVCFSLVLRLRFRIGTRKRSSVLRTARGTVRWLQPYFLAACG